MSDERFEEMWKYLTDKIKINESFGVTRLRIEPKYTFQFDSKKWNDMRDDVHLAKGLLKERILEARANLLTQFDDILDIINHLDIYGTY